MKAWDEMALNEKTYTLLNAALERLGGVVFSEEEILAARKRSCLSGSTEDSVYARTIAPDPE